MRGRGVMSGLSKSRIAAFEQCPRRLWLQVHRRELADWGEGTEALFAIGNEVGEVACALHPNGVMIEAEPDLAARGPSAHQTGPSPSQTCVGLHSKVWPAGTTRTEARMVTITVRTFSQLSAAIAYAEGDGVKKLPEPDAL